MLASSWEASEQGSWEPFGQVLGSALTQLGGSHPNPEHDDRVSAARHGPSDRRKRDPGAERTQSNLAVRRSPDSAPTGMADPGRIDLGVPRTWVPRPAIALES